MVDYRRNYGYYVWDGDFSMNKSKYSQEMTLEPMMAIQQIAMFIMQGATVNYNPRTKKLRVTFTVSNNPSQVINTTQGEKEV